MGIYPQQPSLIVIFPALVTWVPADLLKVFLTDIAMADFDLRPVPVGIGDLQVLNAPAAAVSF